MAARPRRRSRLADLFGRGADPLAATRVQLAPRRLEPRRMLDAAAPALALELAGLSSEYVQASDDFTPQELMASETPAAASANSPPTNIQIVPLGAIEENGVATLELVFDDADPLDTHTVEVDWGDGSVEVFNVSPGSQFFGTTHQYLDDDPSATTSDVYNVGVKVTDSAGDFATASAPITVNNVAPSNLQIAPMAPINENGVGTLELTFDDPGSLDTHTVEVNWGDGNVEVFNVPQGSRFFGTTHQYLDDNPTGTSADNYTVNVRVLDDDGGEIAGSTSINVSNVAPSNLQLAPIADVNENGFAQLNLTFDDPGTLDTHKVEVDWGDGTVELLDVTPGARAFSTTHQYLDDNPTGTASDQYTVKVRLLDDDLGEIAAAPATVTVHNVAPSGIVIDPLAPIDENGVAVLNLTFMDPGSLDMHTVEIDWGDGTIETLPVAAGARALSTSHQYFDDNPTGTPADIYTITVKIRDDDGGMATAGASVIVNNVAPSVVFIPTSSGTAEGSPQNALLIATDIGALDTLSYQIDWGDGHVTSGAVTAGIIPLSHIYADNGVYTVKATVTDDDGGQTTQTVQIAVGNVSPQLTVAGNQTVNEGSLLSITNIGLFTDPGFDNPLNVLDPSNGGETTETFTYTINWGDGTAVDAGTATIDIPGGPGTLTSGSFDGAHSYADNGVYTVTVTVFDDDGGFSQASFEVTVMNVAPTLTVVGNQTVNEGSQLSLVNIGQFSDPGFNNTLNPLLGGETEETFTYSINWGDGTTTDAGPAMIDMLGGAGVPTAGSFDGSHTYADNGVYTVTVTVFDDDGGQHSGTFQVTVSNVAPTLTVIANQTVNEGSLLSVTNIGAFTDPGFNNPINPLPGETSETFTFAINWGDGTATDSGAATVDVLGSVGVPSSGSFDGAHTYADNGVYTVTVTVFDDDGGQHQQSFQVSVLNVAPTLTVVGNQTINEGSLLSLTNIGQFTDPGFNNPLNAGNVSNGGETAETFTFTITWGDGTTADAGVATVDVLGAIGTPTAGSFNGSHTYADDGLYTVTVTLFDDDGGQHQQTFTIQVTNVAPTLAAITDRTTNEGSLLSIANLGQLTDPGFNNPLNPLPGGETAETFTFTINWGDGTATDAGSATVDVLGSPGVPTAASFDGSHTYADDGVYTVTVTIFDDDGGQAVQTFVVTINNVAPTLQLTVDESLIDPIDEGGTTQVTITGAFSDPGFDNPNNTAPGLDGEPSETSESFKFQVDWGDGHKTGEMSLADLNGSPGVDSTGSIAQFFTHHYIDNDLDDVKDARYTVKVTVFDDDGGSNTQTFEVIVYNTNPVLQPISATPVNTKGVTTLTLTFDDLGAPGVESFKILIDWGDQLQEVDLAERFKEQALPVDVPQEGGRFTGPTPHTFVFTHEYDGPPDPLHPTADIVISVKIQDDDFGTATSRPDADPLTIDGQSNIEDVAITNPGLGAEPFRIDTTPQVALLTFPERVVTQVDVTTNEIRAVVNAANDEGGSAGDSRAAGEQYLELRVINPDGSFSEGYRLRPEVLNNLQALFRKLPDNHYAIYLVQSETNNRRLVIEVYVRNGKVIDPGDDSEGARDRPPTDESTTKPNPAVEKALEQAEEDVGASDSTTSTEPAEPNLELPHRLGSSSAVYHRTALAGVALALSGAGRDWHRQFEQALAAARPGQWKRLKTAGHRRRTKPK